MKRFLFGLIALNFFLASGGIVKADLVIRGIGTSSYGEFNLVYDTNSDITFYDYSNSERTNWVDDLEVKFNSVTFQNWREPTEEEISELESNIENPFNNIEFSGSYNSAVMDGDVLTSGSMIILAVNCQGCCSHHGGVVCSDGKTMCADGSSLSSTCSSKGCDGCVNSDSTNQSSSNNQSGCFIEFCRKN